MKAIDSNVMAIHTVISLRLFSQFRFVHIIFSISHFLIFNIFTAKQLKFNLKQLGEIQLLIKTKLKLFVRFTTQSNRVLDKCLSDCDYDSDYNSLYSPLNLYL